MFLFSLPLNAPINGKKTWPCLRFFMLRCIFITKKKKTRLFAVNGPSLQPLVGPSLIDAFWHSHDDAAMPLAGGGGLLTAESCCFCLVVLKHCCHSSLVSEISTRVRQKE